MTWFGFDLVCVWCSTCGLCLLIAVLVIVALSLGVDFVVRFASSLCNCFDCWVLLWFCFVSELGLVFVVCGAVSELVCVWLIVFG